MKSKFYICCGITWFIIGALLIVGASLVKFMIEKKFNPSIIEQDVVTSTVSLNKFIILKKSSPNYDRWVTNDFEGAPPLWEGFYLYNLTNYDDVINSGSVPHFDEIGPFVYKSNWMRLNVTFSEDQELVTYNRYSYFVLNETQSVSDPTETTICNLNPAYLGAISQAGNELAFTIGFTGVVLNKYLTFLTTWFTDGIILQRVPNNLMIAEDFLAGLLNSTDEFLNIWANSTRYPGESWIGMLVSYKKQPSKISMQSAQMLFDPEIPYSLTNNQTSINPWLFAMHGDDSNTTFLKQTFGLNGIQLNMILQWLNSSFAQNWIYNQILIDYQIENIRDLGYLQWGSGTVSPISVRELYPEFNFPTIPEYALWWDDFFTLDVPTSKKLLNGTESLFNPQNVGVFFAQVASGNWSLIEEIWGLSETQVAAEFTPYFMDLAYNGSTSYLHEIFNQGGGLVTCRTVDEWMWTAKDPLLLLVEPAKAGVNFLHNDSSPAQALQRSPSTTYTGKSDTDKIMWYTVFEGITNYTNYPKVIDVAGTTEDGQFPPFLGPYETIYSWSEDYIRNMPLIVINSTQLLGVEVLIYSLDNSTFMVDPNYYQFIKGFVNLTSIKGAPIFLSNPHMIVCDESWIQRISGVVQPDPDRDLTVVSIEPHTGKVLQANKGLQVNAYISDGFQYDLYHPKLAKNIMYPIFWAFERSQVTEELASKLRNSINLTLSLKSYLIPVFIPSGLALIILGFVLVVFIGCLNFRCKRMDDDGYEKIQ